MANYITFIFRAGVYNYQRTIGVRVIRGLTEPDDAELNGPPVHDMLDGGKRREVCGAKKYPTFVIPPLASAQDRRFISAFILASIQTVVQVKGSSTYVSDVILYDPRLISQWLNAIELSRQFTLMLDDTHVYRAWDDGTISTDDEMWFKNKVVMDQNATIDSPQTLTTGSGPLATMEDGTAWPVFNSTVYDYLVLVATSHGAVALYPEDHAVVGGNMQISTFPGSGYITASDGELYSNISVYQRAKAI